MVGRVECITQCPRILSSGITEAFALDTNVTSRVQHH